MESAPVRKEPPASTESLMIRTRKAGPAAVALVIGLAALTAQASETDMVRGHPALLHRLLAECAARPQIVGRLHPGSLLPAADQGTRGPA